MPNGEVRRSQSASFFAIADEQKTKVQNIGKCYDQKMINHLLLTTSTLVGEPIDININLLSPAIQYANNNGK